MLTALECSAFRCNIDLFDIHKYTHDKSHIFSTLCLINSSDNIIVGPRKLNDSFLRIDFSFSIFPKKIFFERTAHVFQWIIKIINRPYLNVSRYVACWEKIRITECWMQSNRYWRILTPKFKVGHPLSVFFPPLFKTKNRLYGFQLFARKAVDCPLRIKLIFCKWFFSCSLFC